MSVLGTARDSEQTHVVTVAVCAEQEETNNNNRATLRTLLRTLFGFILLIVVVVVVVNELSGEHVTGNSDKQRVLMERPPSATDKETELRRQIAALQAQLEDSANASQNVERKRKRDQDVQILVPSSPSKSS